MAGLYMLAVVGLTALAVDVGQLVFQKTWLQATADAAVLAGVHELPAGPITLVTQRIANANYPGGTVVAASDVVTGQWNADTSVFTAGVAPPNALRVTARRATANANPMPTIVMGAFGFPIVDVSAVAIAVRSGTEQTCFLIDDEMIDSDIPAIQQLAASLGKTPDQLISDGNEDGYIDLPPGTQIELPTGQTGDEGVFEILTDSFPFSPTSSPYALEDFLEHQDGDGPIPDGMLDPLVGVRPMTAAEYPSLVDAGLYCVVPVHKSDISNLGSNRVNAKGERRGLLAFSVIAVGADPDGSGSRLPNLVIRVADPSDVTLPDVILEGAGGQLVG